MHNPAGRFSRVALSISLETSGAVVEITFDTPCSCTHGDTCSFEENVANFEKSNFVSGTSDERILSGVLSDAWRPP